MPTRRRLPAVVFGLLAALPFVPSATPAATLSWLNAAGGFAGTASNWNPAQAPTFVDSLVFALGGAYGVTFGVQADSTLSMLVDQGTPTFRFPANHLMAGQLRVGQTAGLTSTLTIESGAAEVRKALHVGPVGGTDAALNVTGEGTSLLMSATLGLSFVGSYGTGRLKVEDGGSVSLGHPIIFGTGAGEATLRILGESSGGAARRSSVAMTNPTGFLSIGQAGEASAEVRDGALLDVAGHLNMAHVGLTDASLTVGGLGALDSAEVNVGGNLNLGTATSGAGRLTVDAYGNVEVGNTTTLGDGSGDDTLEVLNGGRFTTKSLTARSAATDLSLRGGLLQIRGGTLDLDDDPLVVNGTTGGPRFQMSDGATGAIVSTTGPGLLVGDDGSGLLDLQTGSTLEVIGQNVVLADEPGSVGDVQVNVGSALSTDGAIVVGRSGLASLLVREGSSVECADLRVASQAGAIGFAVLRGAGTTGRVAGQLEVCGLASGGSGASGGVVVDSSAHLWLDHPTDAGDLWPTGSLRVENGGTLHIAGTFEARGPITANGGSTDGGAIRLIEGATLTGSGDVASSIGSAGDATGSITATGPLRLGRSVDAGGFDFLGTLGAGAHAVTVRDADSAMVSRATLAGGSITFAGRGVVTESLDGTGTVHGDVALQGSTLATGTDGLAFSGSVTGGDGMSGRYRFLAGATFTGSGAVAGPVSSDSGSTIVAAGYLSFGVPHLQRASALGPETHALPPMVLLGDVVTGPFTVAFGASDSIAFGGVLDIGGGAVVASVPMHVLATGRVAGRGTFGGQIVVQGTIDPGPAAGRIDTGDLTLGSGALTRIDLGSFAAAEHDTIVVFGDAMLAGTLDLRRLGSFVANPGDSFVVVTMTACTGAFERVLLDGVHADGRIEVRYRPNRVVVAVLPGIVDVPQGPAAGAAMPLRFAGRGTPGRAPSLELSLPVESDARIELFDVAGRRLGVLHDGRLAAGVHRFEAWRATTGAGLTFARAEIAGRAGREVRVARVVRLP
jgi:T5SS/PEP-CTERM-associated repeat protein